MRRCRPTPRPDLEKTFSPPSVFPVIAWMADVRVGVMTCDMDSGFGYVLGSSRDLHCTFMPAVGVAEHYAGTISKFGVDIGYVQNAVIV